MLLSAETVAKNAKGAVVVSFVLTIVSVAVQWNQISNEANAVPQPQQDATNYHVFTNLAFWFPMACAALVNSGNDVSDLVKKIATLRYFSFGIATAWISGSITPPSGAATYFDLSFANLNALRIGIERDGDINEGFGNSAFWANWPSNFNVPSDPELVFGGILCGFLGGFIIYNAGSGSAGGLPFQGAMANRKLAGETVIAPGHFAASIVGAVALMLGLIATFLLWTTNIAADPVDQMYGNVFTLIYAALFTGMNGAVAVWVEDSLIAEMALFSVGMFSLTSPVRLWQIESFTKAAMAFNAATDNEAVFDSAMLDNDLDRIRIATVLMVLSGLAVIWCCSAFLQSAYKEKTSPGSTGRDDFEITSMHKGMAAVSTICILTGCGLLWAATSEALEAVGAENSARINAANFYIFLLLIGWLGTAAQLSGLSEVKQLPYVSFGLGTATLIGFLNVGTHDRQLWFLDWTLGGVNELHQWIYNGADFAVDETTTFGRTAGLDADSSCLDYALAGLVLGFLAINLIIAASLSIPTKFERKDTWAATSSTAAKLVYAVSVCFIVGICLMTATTNAQIPMKAMATSNAACNWWDADMSGDSANLFCMVDVNGTYAVPLGERFTANTYDPVDFANADANSYAVAMTFGSLGLFVWFYMLNGVMSESIRMIKLGTFTAGFLWMCLSWVFVYPGRDGSCKLAVDGVDASSEAQGLCHQYVTGLTFLWLEAFLAVVAGAMLLTAEEEAFQTAQDEAKANLPVQAAAPAPAGVAQTNFGITTTAV